MCLALWFFRCLIAERSCNASSASSSPHSSSSSSFSFSSTTTTHHHYYRQEGHDITVPQFNSLHKRQEVGSPPRSFSELRAAVAEVARTATFDVFYRGQTVPGHTCSQNVRLWTLDHCAATGLADRTKAINSATHHDALELSSPGNCTTRNSFLAVWSLCPAGWACWSQRLYDVLSIGKSVPVVMADPMLMPFERFLNWGAFSARVRTAGLTGDAGEEEAARAQAVVAEMHRQARTFREVCGSTAYHSLYKKMFQAMRRQGVLEAGEEDDEVQEDEEDEEDRQEEDDDSMLAGLSRRLKSTHHHYHNTTNTPNTTSTTNTTKNYINHASNRNDHAGAAAANAAAAHDHHYHHRSHDSFPPLSWEETVQGDACLMHPITRTINAIFHARTWLSFEPGEQRSAPALLLLELACRLPLEVVPIACANEGRYPVGAFKTHVRGAEALTAETTAATTSGGGGSDDSYTLIPRTNPHAWPAHHRGLAEEEEVEWDVAVNGWE
jgi:hypothetical protein